jgi:endonuclease YncB( thermonuclease family)
VTATRNLNRGPARVSLAIITMIMASPAFAAPWPICDHGQPRSACVVDGDTIWYHGQKIRLAATDAPEISEPSCAAERAIGLAARDRLAELMGAAGVVHPTGRRDRYGRFLATIQTGAGNAETILVREGLSLPYQPGRAAREARKAHWCLR